MTETLANDQGINELLSSVKHEKTYHEAALKGLRGETRICHILLPEDAADLG